MCYAPPCVARWREKGLILCFGGGNAGAGAAPDFAALRGLGIGEEVLDLPPDGRLEVLMQAVERHREVEEQEIEAVLEVAAGALRECGEGTRTVSKSPGRTVQLPVHRHVLSKLQVTASALTATWKRRQRDLHNRPIAPQVATDLDTRSALNQLGLRRLLGEAAGVPGSSDAPAIEGELVVGQVAAIASGVGVTYGRVLRILVPTRANKSMDDARAATLTSVPAGSRVQVGRVVRARSEDLASLTRSLQRRFTNPASRSRLFVNKGDWDTSVAEYVVSDVLTTVVMRRLGEERPLCRFFVLNEADEKAVAAILQARRTERKVGVKGKRQDHDAREDSEDSEDSEEEEEGEGEGGEEEGEPSRRGVSDGLRRSSRLSDHPVKDYSKLKRKH